MQEINIYDSEGNIIYDLVQWDKDVKIYITEPEIDKAYNVHFFNRNNNEAMVVQSTYENGTLCSIVPNDILTEELPINGYVVIEKNGEYKSLYCFRILVRKRAKPADYIYSDQKEYITFDKILKEVEEYAMIARSYVEGDTSSRPNESTDNAKYYYMQSKLNATNAEISENNALASANIASEKASESETSAINASTSASEALASASAAKISETNANTYYEKTKTLTDSISGALKPMGTVTFEDLPSLNNVSDGSMYNISNQFVTTSEFKEGAGTIVPIGSNVYKTSDGYWDILAGTPVAGVKGENESSYRTGNVNITKENIGLGNVDNTSDNEKSVLSATKLSTARKIGNASFDGTKDITLKETGALDPIGDEFNSSLTYVVGDFCIYNNTLYKCITAIDTAGEWDESKWEATTVATELSLGSDNSVTLTRAEYDALSDEEKDSNTTYYISDEDAQSNAFSVPFTSNKYTATNTGDALIEVKTELEETNSNLSDVVTIITATLNSLTVAANGYGNMSQDISSFIPNGYKCIGACFVSSGSSWFIPVGVHLSGTSVQVYVRNTYAGQDQGKPIINLICIRN